MIKLKRPRTTSKRRKENPLTNRSLQRPTKSSKREEKIQEMMADLKRMYLVQ